MAASTSLSGSPAAAARQYEVRRLIRARQLFSRLVDAALSHHESRSIIIDAAEALG